MFSAFGGEAYGVISWRRWYLQRPKPKPMAQPTGDDVFLCCRWRDTWRTHAKLLYPRQPNDQQKAR
eukprot:6582477-Pyramimonas_sp.AAC.1